MLFSILLANDKNPEVLDVPVDWPLVIVILVVLIGVAIEEYNRKKK